MTRDEIAARLAWCLPNPGDMTLDAVVALVAEREQAAALGSARYAYERGWIDGACAQRAADAVIVSGLNRAALYSHETVPPRPAPVRALAAPPQPERTP